MSRSVWIHHDQSQYLRQCLRDYAPAWKWAFEEYVCSTDVEETMLAPTIEWLYEEWKCGR